MPVPRTASPFALDLGQRELRKHGLPVKLRPQAIEVLAALAESPGRLVSRDELQARLWPGVHYGDFENGLNSAINRLREALGDSARHPRYIETLPGRGYRLIGSITVLPGDGVPARAGLPPSEGPGAEGLPKPPPESPAPPRAGRRPASLVSATRARGLVFTALVLALSAAMTLAWLRNRNGTAAEGPTPVPLVSMGGEANEPSLSPDGSRVVFSWRAPEELSHPPGAEPSGLYLKLIGGDPPQRLTAGATDRRPAWSPDSRKIAFLRDSERGSAVILIPSIGGPERVVGEVDCDPDFSNLSWTPDGRWLVLSARESPDRAYALLLLSVENGERRLLLPPAPAVAGPGDWPGDFAGTLSSDGRTLPFARWVGFWRFRLYRLRLTPDLRPEGSPQPLGERTYTYFNGAAWASPNELVYSAGANCRLWRMRLGGSPQLLNWAPPIAGWPSISGHRLVYSWFLGGDNLWRLDLRTRECTMLVPSNQWQTWPRYSPDGRSIAFTAWRTGVGEVWRCDADGGNCQQLTFSGGSVPRWSPDGRWLATDCDAEGTVRICIMPAAGGAPRPIAGATENSRLASWSRDGRWLYFESDRTGRWRIWKAPVAGGPAIQVTRKNSGAPFESADGKHVYFSAGSAPLFRASAAGEGVETEIAPRVFRAHSFSVGADGVYFMPDERTVQFWDERSHRIVTVAELDGGNSADDGMTVSPDGVHMVFAQRGHVTSDIMLVEDFR